MANDLGWFSVQSKLRVSPEATWGENQDARTPGRRLALDRRVGPSSTQMHAYVLSICHAPHHRNCLLPASLLAACFLPASCFRSRGTLDPHDVKFAHPLHRLDICFPWVSRSSYSAFAIPPSFSGTRRALRVQPSLPGWCSPPSASHPPLFPIAVPSQSPYPP